MNRAHFLKPTVPAPRSPSPLRRSDVDERINAGPGAPDLTGSSKNLADVRRWARQRVDIELFPFWVKTDERIGCEIRQPDHWAFQVNRSGSVRSCRRLSRAVSDLATGLTSAIGSPR